MDLRSQAAARLLRRRQHALGLRQRMTLLAVPGDHCCVFDENDHEDVDPDARRREYEQARRRLYEGLSLRLVDDRLLRKPATKQGRRIEEQKLRLRAEAEKQLRGRPPYEGDVSVELVVMAGDDQQPPQARDVVKAYLDLLGGLAYRDDRQIAHLSVHRSALDHPAMLAGIKRYGLLSWPDRALRAPQVLIRVEPVALYTHAFDRARQRAGRAHGLDDEEAQTPSPWETHWQEQDYIEMEETEDELRALGSRANGFGAQVADFYRGKLAELRTRFLLDAYLSPADRPGPLAADTAESLELVPATATHLFHLQWPGGVFHLPLPEGESRKAWRRTLRAAVEADAQHWRGFAPTQTRLALDIAIRDSGETTGDIDNIAHDVLVAFEEVYCEGRRGSVVAYRAYRAEGPERDLRVLVVNSAQLDALEQHIEAAQAEAIAAWEALE
jgi:hypothetical protein